MKTFEQIIAFVALAIASVFAANVVRRWVRGRPPSQGWTGGAPMSRTGEVAIAAFCLGIALAMVTHTPWPILIAFPAWVVAYWAQYADSKRYRAAMARERAANAERFRELLEPAPTLAAEELPADRSFRAFENRTGVYLGELTREQLQFLIRRNEAIFDGERNDLFILEECLSGMAEQGADPELIELLRRGMGEEHCLFVRWTLGGELAAKSELVA
jgi:hypothetical protein